MQPDGDPDANADVDLETVLEGTWLDTTDESLVERDDLVLAIARRRDATPQAVAEELRAVDAAFDVDGVYVAPEGDGR
jgi:hypothetical protein